MATAERLLLDKTWVDDGQLFASWRPPARRLFHQTRCNLQSELRRSLHRSCVHLIGHGDVKGALRRIMRQQVRPHSALGYKPPAPEAAPGPRIAATS